MASSSKPEIDETWVMIPVENLASDGDPDLWPRDSRYSMADPTTYLEKLAKLWMQKRGEMKPGEHYILSQLPPGYALLSRERMSKPNIHDKFLFGHPSGAYFNSVLRFWDHFVYLMTDKEKPCTCDLCTQQTQREKTLAHGMPRPARGRKPGSKKQASAVVETASLSSRRAGRPKRSTFQAEDEEGNRDIFKELVLRLKLRKEVDQVIEEKESMDWRAEREQMIDHLTRISMQPRYAPRVGELVLWCEELHDDVKFDYDTSTFRTLCPSTQKRVIPSWRAGTVAQVPDEVYLADVLVTAEKSKSINITGYRIETYPSPNSSNKDLSYQYKYIPLSHIRPFSWWDIYLQDVPEKDFHPSISNALTVMSSFSPLEKYHFAGSWPNAEICCKGLYLGAELLVQGDGVRLFSEGTKLGGSIGPVTNILVIEKIILRLSNCDAEPDSPQLAERIEPRIIGKVYTTSKESAYRDPSAPHAVPMPLTEDEIHSAFETVSMGYFGSWYYLHDPKNIMEISIDWIIGRCIESDYMRLVLGSTELDCDIEAVLSAREYSMSTDQRIPENREWFPGDYRLQTLDLETFNGIDVGKNDDARDLKMWRANLNIIDGKASLADLKDAKLPRDKGRQIENIIGGKAASSQFSPIGKMSSLVSTALTITTPGEPASGADSDAEDEEEQEELAGGVSDDDEESSSDSLDELLNIDPRVVRGGTEESEGGDYRPASPSGPPTSKRRKF